jgi:putative tryptophan/tyrosine transport system substrate-binding protein
MRRREFVALVGGAAVGWPLAARGQQPSRIRRIGVFVGNAPSADDPWARRQLQPFQEAMRDAGWIEGKNINIEFRFAAGDPARFPIVASELVASAPEVIYAISHPAVEAVLRITHAVPIVFSEVADPIGPGYVASLAHPGGNVTGFVVWEPAMAGKWVQLLTQIAPSVEQIGVMYQPDLAFYAPAFISAAAPAIGHSVTLTKCPVRDDRDIEDAVASLGREPPGGLWIIADPFTVARGDIIIADTARFRVPAIYTVPGAVTRGGLISYTWAFDMQMRQPASYVDRILKGESPSALPVQAPTKYDLAINLKTAKALDLDVPQTLLATADEVIE